MSSIQIPRISIIVPAYNAEKYLSRCLDSIIAQTETNWETIIVNDGSTDGTSVICEDYCSKDGRVKYYSISNSGVSNARNYGLTKAKGDWVLFVDADDSLYNNVVADLLEIQKAENCDIVIFSFVFDYGNTKAECLAPDLRFNIKDLLEGKYPNVNYDLLLCSPCNKLYRRNVLMDNNIRFELEMKFGEDFQFNSQYFSVVHEAVATSKVKYLYDCGIPNSGVKKIYPNFGFFVKRMDESLLEMAVKNLCNMEGFNPFRLRFISQRYDYFFGLLIDNKAVGFSEKAQFLSELLGNTDAELIEYMSISGHPISQFALMKQEGKITNVSLLEKNLRSQIIQKERKGKKNNIKRVIKRILGLC